MLPVNTRFLNKFNLVVFDRIYTSTTAANTDNRQFLKCNFNTQRIIYLGITNEMDNIKIFLWKPINIGIFMATMLNLTKILLFCISNE